MEASICSVYHVMVSLIKSPIKFGERNHLFSWIGALMETIFRQLQPIMIYHSVSETSVLNQRDRLRFIASNDYLKNTPYSN